MGIFVFIMFIGFVFLVALALIVTGITLVVLGSEDKKKGGKGTRRTIGIVLVAIPIFITVSIWGKTLWDNARIKCVADEWRYKPYVISRSAVTASQDMLSSMLESADDKDKDMIYREFSPNVRDDRHFEETVDEFLNDIDKLGVDLDPDVFLKGYPKSAHIEDINISGYIFSAEIDGETYYCYVKICYSGLGNKDNLGLQQFIICTKDKEDEFNKIIEEGNDDIYLKVL